MNFKKLKQLSNDIDLLEQSGKYTAAEVLHKKFIKEAQKTQVVNNVQNYQARPGEVNERIVYPGQGNAFERGDNFARSERGGEGTLYNFKGLQPEMEPVRVQTSPGNFTTVLKPKNNIGNPYATRPADPFRNIPGYNELSRLTNDASLIRNFVDANGTSTDAGKAIYNELLSQNANRPVSNTTTQTVPMNDPVTQSPATPTATPTSLSKTPTIDPNYKGYETPTTTGPNPTPSTEPQSAVTNFQTYAQGGTVAPQGQQQPAAQDNFQNYYTEQSDTASLYQQQNSNPNAQQESIEQKLYINALNNIENAFKYNDRNTAETIYNKTINEFKNPKRRDLFGKQIQRVRSKYLNPAINQGPKQ